MSLQEDIRTLLMQGFKGTQTELRSQLAAQGINATQSSISRTLQKMNARKIDGRWQIVTTDLGSPVARGLTEHVVSVQRNEALVVIRTPPGSAHYVGSVIDQQNHPDILGTLAGDDTIMVIPTSTQNIRRLTSQLKQMFDREDQA